MKIGQQHCGATFSKKVNDPRCLVHRSGNHWLLQIEKIIQLNGNISVVYAKQKRHQATGSIPTLSITNSLAPLQICSLSKWKHAFSAFLAVISRAHAVEKGLRLSPFRLELLGSSRFRLPDLAQRLVWQWQVCALRRLDQGNGLFACFSALFSGVLK